MRLAAEDQPHQLVIGGMELDDVDAMAEAVMRAQLGQVPVGLAGQVLDLGAADQDSGLLQAVGRPVGAEDMNRVDAAACRLNRGRQSSSAPGWFITSCVA